MLVPLVTGHHLHVVQSEGLVEVEGLRVVLREVRQVVLDESAVLTGGRTLVGVAVGRALAHVVAQGVDRGQTEPRGELHVEVELRVELVSCGAVLVVAVGADRVTGRQEQTCTVALIACAGHTVVVLVATIGVLHDIRIAVGIDHAHVERVDGRDILRVESQVGGIAIVTLEVRVLRHVGVDVVHVDRRGEPVGDLVVGLDTT